MSLLGTWSTGCHDYGDGFSSTATVVFTDAKVTVTSSEFGDDKCVTLLDRGIKESTYVIGASLASPAGAYEFDRKGSKVTLMFTADMVANAINDKTCGRSDWQANVEVDVSSSGDCATKAVYDLIKVSGNKMTLGSTDSNHDASSAAQRPITLEGTFVYTKQ